MDTLKPVRLIIITGIFLLLTLIAQTSMAQGAYVLNPSTSEIGLPQNQTTPTVELTPTPNALGLTEAEIKAGQPTGIIFGAILLVGIVFVSVIFRFNSSKQKKSTRNTRQL